MQTLLDQLGRSSAAAFMAFALAALAVGAIGVAVPFGPAFTAPASALQA